MARSTVLGEENYRAIADKITEMGLFLEEIRLSPAGKNTRLLIIIDLIAGNGLLDSKQLVQASREISDFLDDLDPIKGEYNLEISTPGAERKLTTPRHFSRVKGRKIKVLDGEGKEFRGMLVEVEDEAVILEQEAKTHKIFFNEIKNAQVELDF